MNETDNQLDALLNTLLMEQPLAPLPPHFARQVLAQLYTPEPFRMRWTDAFWSALGALVLSVLFLIGFDSSGLITLGWLPNLSITIGAIQTFTQNPLTMISLLITLGEIFLVAIFYIGFADIWRDDFA